MRLTRWYQMSVLFSCLLCPGAALTQVLSVTPSITVGQRYDDNIFQRPDDGVRIVDENGQERVLKKEDDFITVITPGIELRYAPSRDTEANFSYKPSFEIFANDSDQNQLAHALALGVEAELSRRFSLTLNDRLTITEEPNDRLREIGDVTDTREGSDEGRQRTIRNVADAALRFRLTPRSTISLLVSNLIEDVDEEDEVDEINYSAGLELGYLTNVSRGNRVFVSYEVAVFTFDSNRNCANEATEADRLDCEDEVREDEDDFNVHTASVGYEHHFNPTLTATAQIGYSFTREREEDLGGDDAGIVGRLRIEKLLRTGSASLQYARSFTSGGGEGGEVIEDRFAAQLRANLTPKIAALLGASVNLSDFQADRNDDRDRLFYTIRPGLTYQVLQTLQLFTNYAFAQSLFDEESQADRIEHRVTAGARLILRTALSLELRYEYRTRSFESPRAGTNDQDRSDDEFSRNLVTLSLTYGPTFRF